MLQILLCSKPADTQCSLVVPWGTLETALGSQLFTAAPLLLVSEVLIPAAMWDLQTMQHSVLSPSGYKSSKDCIYCLTLPHYTPAAVWR